MALELISFPLCPYVQRSIITLLHKQVGFTLTHIDLAHKPEWFLALSPMGKVPCLKIDEHTVLFESQVINEYLDETIAPALHPADPLKRAQHRAWIAFGSEILNDQFQMMIAQGGRTFRRLQSPAF
jgi:Glutathione S-transferase